MSPKELASHDSTVKGAMSHVRFIGLILLVCAESSANLSILRCRQKVRVHENYFLAFARV